MELEMANLVYMVSGDNFDNKKFSIAILICTCKSCMINLLPFFLLLKIQGLACDRHRNMAGLNWLHGSDLSVSEIFYVLYPPANIITVPFIFILETKSLSANRNSTFPTHWYFWSMVSLSHKWNILRWYSSSIVSYFYFV
jgi:hypothetical protein